MENQWLSVEKDTISVEKPVENFLVFKLKKIFFLIFMAIATQAKNDILRFLPLMTQQFYL